MGYANNGGRKWKKNKNARGVSSGKGMIKQIVGIYSTDTGP